MTSRLWIAVETKYEDWTKVARHPRGPSPTEARRHFEPHRGLDARERSTAYAGHDWLGPQPSTQHATFADRRATVFRLCLILPCALAIWSGVGAAGAETVLLDFEQDAELRLWHYERQTSAVPVKELSRAERFATSGLFALRFASPVWKPGLPEWPAVEIQPPVKNWSGYDRLVFDVTNVTGAEQKLCLFLSDSKIATRDGLLWPSTLAPFSFTRVVIPLAKLAERRVNPADMHVLHLFTERPSADMEVYVDRVALLRPQEPLPAVPPAFVKQFTAVYQQQLVVLDKLLQEGGIRVRTAAAGSPEVVAWANAALQRLQGELNSVREQARQGDAGLLAAALTPTRLQTELQTYEALAKLRARFAQIRPAVQVGNEPRTDLVVGFASSMEKILPRAQIPSLTVADKVEVSLAQNERESFQVIVLPCEQDVRAVRVRVGELQSETGAGFAAKNVEAVLMGYVQTQQTPPYGSSHVGWWPDPILNFQTTADIARGDAQAFWVRVRAPQDQPPGLYRGKLEVELAGVKTLAFDLTVRVYGFRLPDRSPLPLAVTFWPMYYEPNANGQGYGEGESRDAGWKQHKAEWADFLGDYYLSYDSLYSFGSWAPDFELLVRIQKQGRLGRFNLGYYGPCGSTPAEIAAWRKATVEVIRPRYEQAQRLGLLEHAYIYGCDEAPAELFPGVQRAAELLKAEFPGVLIMTTTYDHSFGAESVIKAMDAFCPLTPRFDPQLAARARKAGKQVWWYICCGPHHPHANMFVEYPAIEGRLLMGPMTAKYRPDGFLYYQISIWNSPPITTGPFTAWNPRSWTTYHGDGSWTCLGPGGTPLPTIRLENFRDGLEDFAYYRILEATVAKVEASAELREPRAQWLKQAHELLVVPDSLVKSVTEYSRDPAAVYRYRTALAEAILAAGIEPARL